MAVDLCFFLNGQDQPGVRHSHFAGVGALTFSPTGNSSCSPQAAARLLVPTTGAAGASQSKRWSRRTPLSLRFLNSAQANSARQSRKAHFWLQLCLGTGSCRLWLHRVPVPSPLGLGVRVPEVMQGCWVSAFASSGHLTATSCCHPVRSSGSVHLCASHRRGVRALGRSRKRLPPPAESGMATGLHALRISRAWASRRTVMFTGLAARITSLITDGRMASHQTCVSCGQWAQGVCEPMTGSHRRGPTRCQQSPTSRLFPRLHVTPRCHHPCPPLRRGWGRPFLSRTDVIF